MGHSIGIEHVKYYVANQCKYLVHTSNIPSPLSSVFIKPCHLSLLHPHNYTDHATLWDTSCHL